ncbi:hypothetical protein HPP92_020157 [Vanilla planifolia]|uniref:Dienelactone hydrolase domain-containing protein n=1 Tax=Vanilla planifolia TaxID=51239 RepID=A0A835Q7W7_VANPL|nr:hypothetical protein HPP92_020157 [Vanilla planifolia]
MSRFLLRRQKIQIQREDTAFDAYIIGKENAPAIVVVPEFWGVYFEVKNHAQKIASLAPGYRALIPDLYRGKVGLDVAEAQHLMESLDWPSAVKDIDASLNWLKSNGSSKFLKLMLWLGFYGAPSAELVDATKANAPVQAHFGELDSLTAKQLEEKLESSGVPNEVNIYAGVGHAFLNVSPEGKQMRKNMGMNDDDPAAVELAWWKASALPTK